MKFFIGSLYILISVKSLLRGFTVSVQCSRSNTKNLWPYSFKSGINSRKKEKKCNIGQYFKN